MHLPSDRQRLDCLHTLSFEGRTVVLPFFREHELFAIAPQNGMHLKAEAGCREISHSIKKVI